MYLVRVYRSNAEIFLLKTLNLTIKITRERLLLILLIDNLATFMYVKKSDNTGIKGKEKWKKAIKHNKNKL